MDFIKDEAKVRVRKYSCRYILFNEIKDYYAADIMPWVEYIRFYSSEIENSKYFHVVLSSNIWKIELVVAVPGFEIDLWSFSCAGFSGQEN